MIIMMMGDLKGFKMVAMTKKKGETMIIVLLRMLATTLALSQEGHNQMR